MRSSVRRAEITLPPGFVECLRHSAEPLLLQHSISFLEARIFLDGLNTREEASG